MIEKVRLKAQIIWCFPSIVNVVKITRPLRSYRTPKNITARDNRFTMVCIYNDRDSDSLSTGFASSNLRVQTIITEGKSRDVFLLSAAILGKTVLTGSNRCLVSHRTMNPFTCFLFFHSHHIVCN